MWVFRTLCDGPAQFGCRTRTRSRSRLGSAVHLALEELEPIDMAFNMTAAPTVERGKSGSCALCVTLPGGAGLRLRPVVLG